MTTVEFIFEGNSYKIQCSKEEILENIFSKFAFESGQELESIYFIFGGNILNKESKVSNISKGDENTNIKILVYTTEKPDTLLEKYTTPKFIMCPNCNEIIKYKFDNYKITLYECRNDHKVDNISLEKFKSTQKYNMEKIICYKCQKNKAETSFNEFHKCLTCSKYLCPLCRSTHDKSHNIINMDKNYVCSIHNEPYSHFCSDCKVNICVQCNNEHKTHKNVFLGDILPNMENINETMNDFKSTIDEFKNNIEAIKKMLDKVVNNFEKYYKLLENIKNNYQIKIEILKY